MAQQADGLARGWRRAILVVYPRASVTSLLGQCGDSRPRAEYGSLLPFSGIQSVGARDDPTLTRDSLVVVPTQQVTIQGCPHFLSFCQQHQNMLAFSPTNFKGLLMLKSNTKLFKMPGILVPPCFLHTPAGRRDMLSRDPDWPELALYTINNLNTYTHKHTHTHPASIQSQECRNQHPPAGLFQSEITTPRRGRRTRRQWPTTCPVFFWGQFLGRVRQVFPVLSGSCAIGPAVAGLHLNYGLIHTSSEGPSTPLTESKLSPETPETRPVF